MKISHAKSRKPSLQMGAIIRMRRASLGIEQRALSEICGVATHTLSNIESGRGNPTVSTLERLLDALGMELRIEISTGESHDAKS